MSKKLIIYLASFLLIVLLNPVNTQALQENVTKYNEENKILTCKYEYEYSEGVIRELNYEIYPDTVKLAFLDGTKYNNSKTPWYHGAAFLENYNKASKIDEKTYVCPTLTIEKNANFVTVFNNPKAKDKCNGECKTLVAKEAMLSSIAKKKAITTKKVIATTVGGSVGIYQSTKYFLPYFRILDDGTKEWSLNGKKYINVKDVAIIENSKNKKIKIALNKDLIEKIFENNTLTSDIIIYRCVTKLNKNEYLYLLSLNENKCLKNDLSKEDGQEIASSSYNGALGEKEKEKLTEEDLDEWLKDYDQEQKCSGEDSLLGNPNDEDSVAWLLQQILNYLKVLGPMIVVIMSSVEFGKAIIQSDDETMAKAQKKLVYRLILAASLFFIPNLVTVLLTIFGITSDPLCGLE